MKYLRRRHGGACVHTPEIATSVPVTCEEVCQQFLELLLLSRYVSVRVDSSEMFSSRVCVNA